MTRALAGDDLTYRAAPRPAPESGSVSLRVTLIAVGFVAAIMSSLGAPLIPEIARSSGVSLSVADWLLTATLLTGAVMTPVMGRLADGPHARRVLLVAMSSVLVGAVLAALTSTFAVLLAARAMQGVGLGLMPVTMAMARRHLPRPVAAQTIALLSITSATGIGLGYPLTAVVAEFAGYHAAFWTGAGLIAVVIVMAVRFLPKRSETTSSRFDTGGAVLLAAAITLLVIGVSEGENWGWTSPAIIGMLLAAIILTFTWGRYELTMTGEPLVELRHTRDRMVLTADIAGFLISVSLYLAVPTIVQFVQAPTTTGYGFGSSIIIGGCSLIPLSAGTLVASRYGARFERRFGQRPMIPVGSAIFTAAMLLFAFEHSYIWEAFVMTALSGVGMGFTFAAMPSFIVRSVASHQTGSAMGFYQVVRGVGLAVGSAIAAVILASFTSGSDPFPRVEGFQTCLFLGAGLCVLAGVVSYFLPGRMTGVPAVTDETIIETAELEGSGILLDAHPIESAVR